MPLLFITSVIFTDVVWKLMIAIFTSKWIFSFMNNTSFQGFILRKWCITYFLSKWFLLLMYNQNMFRNVPLSSESEFANFTFKWLAFFMNFHHVINKFKFFWKGSLAVIAFNRALASFYMSIQSTVMKKIAITSIAFE